MSTPNKYANVGGTKVIPVCPCEDANCPYPKHPIFLRPRGFEAKITHYRTWGMDHILLMDGSRIELNNHRPTR